MVTYAPQPAHRAAWWRRSSTSAVSSTRSGRGTARPSTSPSSRSTVHPPRARGRYYRHRAPAGAGTAACHTLSLICFAVHLRGRGDGRCSPARMRLVDGSPPRARGRHVRDQLHVQPDRFTPAGAGTARP
jgi:hypothetical protein